jgi:hypothetical protein
MERVSKENPSWDSEMLTQAQDEYVAYLATCKENPSESFRPSELADKVWHAHILHTRQYVSDCQGYFGYYLHHEPDKSTCMGSGCMNNGISGTDDAPSVR